MIIFNISDSPNGQWYLGVSLVIKRQDNTLHVARAVCVGTQANAQIT